MHTNTTHWMVRIISPCSIVFTNLKSLMSKQEDFKFEHGVLCIGRESLSIENESLRMNCRAHLHQTYHWRRWFFYSNRLIGTVPYQTSEQHQSLQLNQNKTLHANTLHSYDSISRERKEKEGRDGQRKITNTIINLQTLSYFNFSFPGPSYEPMPCSIQWHESHLSVFMTTLDTPHFTTSEVIPDHNLTILTASYYLRKNKEKN